MVSSSVYGVEELLERVYSLLTAFGYEVWMSHKGTIPVSSSQTAFESCLAAVEKCDCFLGLITPSYGSGVPEAGGLSITHLEMKRAIERKKPRWFLAHDHVVFARRMLIDLGYKGRSERAKLKLRPKAMSIGDLKILDMYEDATMENLPMDDRQGNWVQKFERDDDANLFVLAQFSRYQDVELRLKEQFEDLTKVEKTIKGNNHG